MKDLIARYDAGLRARIGDIVRSVEGAGTARPAYVYDVKAIKVMPPIMYPTCFRVESYELAGLRN